MTTPDDAKTPPPDADGRSNGFFGRRMTLQSPNEALQPEAAPPPPVQQRSRKRSRLSALSGFLSFLLIIAVVAMAGVVWGVHRLGAPGPLTADKVVIIPRAEFLDITAQLEREGVIENTLLFNAALIFAGNRSKLKEGEYLFKQNASLRDVMDTLVSGKQILHTVTLPEGLTSEQIVQRLSESDVLGGDVRDMPKEGSLLPETYKVTRGTTRSDLIKKMQDDQRKVVDQIWARRASDLPLRSPYELIILASIVEKETGKADERPRVAGVFMNRLQKHMRLQSDPTIVYGLVGGKGSLGHSISRAELDKFTPYNTYAIEGLPPGPIANPGRAALEAVANPSRTQDLYFVADGTGGHVFAATIDEHSRNVQRWRQIEKDAKDKIAPDVDKTVPAATPKPGQRSELDQVQSVYGALPDSIDQSGVASYAGPSLAMTPAGAAIARLAPLPEATAMAIGPAVPDPVDDAKKPVARSQKPLNGFNMGPGVDDLGLKVPTADGRLSAADALDGPAPPVQPSDIAPDTTAFTMSAARRAELKDRAARAGLNPGADNATQAQGQNASGGPNGQQVAHAIYDVSEGTSMDPLLNKTYDLNSAKTVPSMK